MIRLDEVAIKLENILNGTDAEIASLDIVRPNDFVYSVQTEGFHIDHIYNKDLKKNFIPVFISSMGGNFNPVLNLLEATYIIPISIYFPVRFKNEMFAMNEYLAKIFVGRYLNYGAGSGYAISNINVAQFGEIQDLDLKQFAKWTEEKYSMSVEIMEPWLSMQINLYLTNMQEGFIFGNQIKYDLSLSVKETERRYLILNGSGLSFDRTQSEDITINGVKYYGWKNETTVYYTKNYYFDTNETYYALSELTMVPTGTGYGSGQKTETHTYNEELIWSNSGTGVSISPMSQQLIDVDSYAKNTPNITNFNKSIVALIRDNDFWIRLLNRYNNQNLKEITDLALTKTYNFETPLTFNYSQLILTLNENIALGEPLTMTITFGDRYVE